MKHTVMFFKFPENFPVSILLDHNPGISPHRHEETELVIVLSGAIEITVDTCTYILHRNDTIIINSFTAHAIITQSSGVICSVLLNFSQAAPYFKRYFSTSYVCNSVLYPDQDNRELCCAVGRIARWSSRSSGKDELMFYSLFYSLMYVLNTKYASLLPESPSSEQGNPSRIRQVLTYIQNHYLEPVTLDDLAKVIHITPQYLSRLFREFTGESVLSYLTSVRLNFAYLKLFDAGLSLEDIAQSTGFPSVRSFSSAFKQSYGQTPGEYRKSLSLATEGKDTPASSQNDELLKAEKQLFSFGQSENAPAAFPVLNERHEIYEIVLSSVDRCCPPFRKKVYFDSPEHIRSCMGLWDRPYGIFARSHEIFIRLTHHPDLELLEHLLRKNINVSLVADPYTDNTPLLHVYRQIHEYFPENLCKKISLCIRAGKNLSSQIRAAKDLSMEIQCRYDPLAGKQASDPRLDNGVKIILPLNLDQPLDIPELQKSLSDLKKAALTGDILFHWPNQHDLKSFDCELAMIKKIKSLKNIGANIVLDSAMLQTPQGLVTPFSHGAGMVSACHGQILFESPQALCVRHGSTYQLLITRNCPKNDLEFSMSQFPQADVRTEKAPARLSGFDPAAMELHLLSMENGTFEESIVLMSQNQGNLYHILKGFSEDVPMILSEKDYINSKSLPEYQKRKIQITDSVCHITLSFPSDGMALILLKKLDE
ncbi:MAG TPA: AraC family transcriptional regulator [Candidatus Scybalocola faecavium]|nr:AraC family transcriptional regulator [Candidatus Scybalocola faecavium]